MFIYKLPTRSAKITLTDLDNIVKHNIVNSFFHLYSWKILIVRTLNGVVITATQGMRNEDFIENNPLCLLNDGSNTYLHPGHGTYWASNLTICQPEIFLDPSWKIWHDLKGSARFPVIITINGRGQESSIPRWQIKKANWYQFQILCYERYVQILLRTSQKCLYPLPGVP